MRRLAATFEMLAEFPEMGTSSEDLAPGLRSFPVGNFVIFYKPWDNGIAVARVLSGHRDLPRLF